jgi:hypothetical protein
MKLSQIAAGIEGHLKRFEADPQINRFFDGRTVRPYYHAGAGASGRFVYVKYVSYQGTTPLTKPQAIAYLNWLDAGNIGKHYAVIDALAK